MMISPSVTTFLPLMSVRGRIGGDDLQAVVTRLMTASAALRRGTTALQTGDFSIGTSGEDYFGTHTQRFELRLVSGRRTGQLSQITNTPLN